MAWSYDPALPTARDRARLAIGDTDGANQLRQDETIDALVAAHGEAEATARLAEGLATQFGRQPGSVAIPGGPTVSWGDRVRAWTALAGAMRTAAAVGTAATVSTGAARDGRRAEAEYRRPAWAGQYQDGG